MKNLNDRENNEMLFPTILKKIQSENVKTESQPLVKYHSFDQKKPTEKMDFKVLWVLNRLSKMQLDMNLCYFLLEKQNCETIEPEKLLNVVLNQYLSNDPPLEATDQGFDIKNSATQVFNKMISMKKTKKRLTEEEKMISIKNNVNCLPEKVITVEIIINDDPGSTEKTQCSICLISKKDAQFTKISQSDYNFCTCCLKDYLNAQINSRQVLDIVCPDGCGSHLTDSEIQTIVPHLYDQYVIYKKLALLNQDPSVRWCVQPGCLGYMKGDANSKKLICNLCSQEVCFNCREAWHEGQSCEDAMNKNFQDLYY